MGRRSRRRWQRGFLFGGTGGNIYEYARRNERELGCCHGR